MNPILANRAKQTTQTTGTGTYVLDAGAIAGFKTLVNAAKKATGVSAGPWNVQYAVIGSGQFEAGFGTLTTGASDTLTRDSVMESSSADAPVNWTAGTRTVIITWLAQTVYSFLNLGTSGLVEKTGFIDYALVPINALGKSIIAATSQAIARAAIQAQADVITTAGDIVRGSFAGSVAQRYAIGATDALLTVIGGMPTWVMLVAAKCGYPVPTAPITGTNVKDALDQVAAFIAAIQTALGLAFSKSYSAPPQAIVEQTTLGPFTHLLGAIPKMVTALLTCLTAEYGYSVGDKILLASNVGHANDQGHVVLINAITFRVILGNGAAGKVYNVIKNDSSGGTANLTNANWNVTFTAYA